MLRKIILIFAIAMLDASALSAQSLIDGEYPKNAPISFKQLHRSVSEVLNDPSSAQYKEIHLPAGREKSGDLCGLVNAKNQMGGYGPFMPFQYVGGTGKTMIFQYMNDPSSRLQGMDLKMFQLSGC